MPRAKKTVTASKIAEISEAAAKRTSAANPGPSPSMSKSNGELETAIRTRAYQLYEERGRTDGRDMDDWVRAEREILAQQGKRSA